MSMISNKRYVFLCLLLFCAFGAVAQSAPKVCTNLEADYTFISSDILVGLDDINCEVNKLRELKLASPLADAKIYFNVDENFTFSSGVVGSPISETDGVSEYFVKGSTWVVLEGKISNQKVMTCKKYDFVDVSNIKVSSDLCKNPFIEIKLEYPRQYENYEVDWGDGKTEIFSNSAKLEHVFNTSFEEIKVRGVFLKNDAVVCASKVETLKRDIPQATFLNKLSGLKDATEIQLRYLGNPNIVYRIERSLEKNNFDLWEDISDAEANEGTIIGLNPDEKQCFRLATQNSCGEKFYSENSLCNIVLDKEVLSSKSMKITWNLPKKQADLPILESFSRRTNNIVDVNLTSSNAKFEYLDENVKCGQEYFYKVGLTYPEIDFEGEKTKIEIETSFLSKQISETILHSSPPYMASVSNEDQQLIFKLMGVSKSDKVVLNQVNYYFSPNKKDYTLKNTSKALEYIENKNTGCFKYDFEDICGVKTGVSEPFCSIDLGLNKTSLVWNEFEAPSEVYTPLENPIYIIEVWNQELGNYEEVDEVEDLKSYDFKNYLGTTDDPILKFRVRLKQKIILEENQRELLNILSSEVEFVQAPEFFIPNAFTPNQDGYEPTESFQMNFKFVKEGHYKIFDRLGQQVFRSKDLKEVWSGKNTKDEKSLPEGLYYYVVSGLSFDNQPINKQGSVYLLR